jgi:hypothetical protein
MITANRNSGREPVKAGRPGAGTPGATLTHSDRRTPMPQADAVSITPAPGRDPAPLSSKERTDRFASLVRALPERDLAIVEGVMSSLSQPLGDTSPDPLLALVATRKRLNEGFSYHASADDDQQSAACARFCEADAELCDRIAGTVAISGAGLLAQAEVLRGLVFDLGSDWADDRDIRLFDTIVAGIRNLTGSLAKI